jgi:hypothetical protein
MAEGESDGGIKPHCQKIGLGSATPTIEELPYNYTTTLNRHADIVVA